MNQEKIGKFIKKLRNDRKLTQQDLADKLGVTNRAVSKWENGLSLPDYSILNDLCEVLDISINELLSGEKIKKEDYQKKFEENVFKSISYKIKKNNKRNLFKSIIAIIIIILIIIFGRKVYIFFDLGTDDNIKFRNNSIKENNLIYKDIEMNDSANRILIDDNISMYIPDDYKEYSDFKSHYLVESNCSTFIKNLNSEYEYDGYIKICDATNKTNIHNEYYERKSIGYLSNKNINDPYDYIWKFNTMKNVNIFSSLNDIYAFNFLVDNYGFTDTAYDIYMLKRDLIKAVLFSDSDVFTGESEDNVTFYSASITEKGIPVNKYSTHYQDYYYNLEIEDTTNELKVEDVIKMIESIKVRGEAGFAKFLRD